METTLTTKPINLEVETDFLVSLLKNGDEIDHILSLGINEDHFLNPKNKIIAKSALKLLYEIEENSVKASLLKDYVNRDQGTGNVFRHEKELDDYITKLYLIDISKKDTLVLLAQSLLKTSQENVLKLEYNQMLSDGEINDGKLAKLQGLVDRLRTSKVDYSFISQAEAITMEIKNIEKKIEDARNGIKNEDGLLVLIPSLDSLLGGLLPGQLVVIASRPGVGKTTFASNAIINIANKHPLKNIVLFSLEMSVQEIAGKIACIDLDLNQSELKQGTITQNALNKIRAYIEEEKGKNIFYCENKNITAHEISALCKKLNNDLTSKGREPLSMIVIDYIQLISSPKSNNSTRENQVSEISRRLKILAGELKCPIIALSQVNRLVEQRKERKHFLSDLRESGSIEQDADIVVFLTETEDRDSGKIVVDVAKNRSGTVGSVTISFDRSKGTFRPLSPDEGVTATVTSKGTSYTKKKKDTLPDYFDREF